MIPSLSLLLNKSTKRRYLSSVILIVLAAMSVNAQAPGSSRGLTSGDGNHMIQGRVHFPPGQTVASKVVKVTLESTNSIGGLSTSSDEDGTFRFNGLRAGNYNVIVEGGKEYENAREPVSIDPTGTSSAAIQVNIQLRPRVDASNPAFAGVPQQALDLYQKGTAAAQKNNAKGAVEFLSQAVAAYPNFSIALSELGIQYMKLKQMDKAADTYQTLLKLKPADALAHLNLGIALFNLNKVEEAEVQLREAVKHDSLGPTAHYYLGVTLIKLKQNEEAQKELELAVSNGGDNLAPAHKYLGALYWSAHRNPEAIEEFEKYLKLDPTAADANKIKDTISKLRGKP